MLQSSFSPDEKEQALLNKLTEKLATDILLLKLAHDQAITNIQQDPALNPFFTCYQFQHEWKQGVLTLTSQVPHAQMEIKVKTPGAYTGPQTQDYLDRLDSKIEAAQAWIEQNCQGEEKKNLLIKIKNIQDYFSHTIKKNCVIDPKKLLNQNYQDPTYVAHFFEQHEKACQHLGAFLEILINTLNKHNPEKLIDKKQLYQQEVTLLSEKPRPKLITIRSMEIENKQYIEINDTSPVNKDKTASSAHKTEAGVANWLTSTTAFYAVEQENAKPTLTPLDTQFAYRSASIVPHELFKKDRISRALARETARRNVEEHIIPALLEEKKRTHPHLNPPIKIDYELMTLISPIHTIADVFQDPDYRQFNAMRNAINFYDRQEIDINGTRVQFTGIYHNYGTNPGRGLPTAKNTNRKAYNALIDRSIEKLEGKFNDSPLAGFIKGIPKFTSREQFIIQTKQYDLMRVYATLKDGALSKIDHETLMKLHAKKVVNKESLGNREEEYNALLAKFKHYHANNTQYRKEAASIEKDIRGLHRTLAKRRSRYFNNHLTPAIAVALTAKEGDEVKSNLTFKANSDVQHLRTLLEYIKASEAGYDSFFKRLFFRKNLRKANKRNYEIQSYIQKLNSCCDAYFHKTCKSGKDRTGAAEEKYKAKHLLHLHRKILPHFNDSKVFKAQEREQFEAAMRDGPIKDICRHNMPPGAPQVSQTDIYTTKINLIILKAMASLQKGIDHIIPRRALVDFHREVMSKMPLSPSLTPHKNLHANQSAVPSSDNSNPASDKDPPPKNPSPS